MNRDWMWLPNRLSRDYVEGVKSFIQVAKEHLRWDNKTRCPCRDCQNAGFNDLLIIELIKMDFHGEEHESQPNGQNDIGVDTEIVDTTDDDILNEVVDALNDACGHIDNDINLEESTTHGKFDYLLGEANKELYPGCKKFSALTFLVKLMHIKVLNRWSDKSFDMLLQVLVDAFPERSNIPKTYYDTKKMLRDLGLGYDSIHACKYDCALFWNENETLDKCPVCDEPQYKFCNGKEPRNDRLGLATDGFNPFGSMSNSYSMWPIVLVPYNMAPWKYIDVYLRPLIEELKELWHEVVQTFDVSTGENFRMHTCVLWTINDFLAYGNLAGWSTKGYKAYPVCNEDTSSLGIRKCSLVIKYCNNCVVLNIGSLLERIFSPAFFDVMVHLMVPLPCEAKLVGPNLGTLKRYVRNKAQPKVQLQRHTP
ncbi:hypothetical protein AAG906_012251 [Vitis piasezkii]